MSLSFVTKSIASRTMQTGQNSIAPENRLPHLGQVRRGFVFMDPNVLRIANIEHPVMIVNGTKDSEPGQVHATSA
jgi:hypothetical protein